jgi:hypothetical protein
MKKFRPYLYGAYGSNLSFRQMAYRCPNAEAVGVLELQDFALRFRGVADIEKSEGSSVMLGLWQVTKDCEHRLDVYEGAPSFYRKELVKIPQDHPLAGHEQVMVYIMNRQHDINPPPHQYLHGIAEGYSDFKIELDPLLDAVKHSYAHEVKHVKKIFKTKHKPQTGKGKSGSKLWYKQKRYHQEGY